MSLLGPAMECTTSGLRNLSILQLSLRREFSQFYNAELADQTPS
jgi:hypothetical protein